MMSIFSKLNEAIDQIQSDRDVQTGIIEREAEALHSILAKLWLHPPNDLPELVLVDRGEEVKTGANSGFSVINRLVFHMEGRLSRQFGVSRFDRPGHNFEIRDADFDLTFEAAIALFGFESICDGLLKQLEKMQSEMHTAKHEERLERANSILEALREADKIALEA
jgi:hypothetical protein